MDFLSHQYFLVPEKGHPTGGFMIVNSLAGKEA
jgi:hypothetical protein